MQNLAGRIEGPVAVIGDLHGQAEELESILTALREAPDYQERWIVFIGDFVDRGPDPKRIMEMVLDLCREHPKTTAVAGNHDLAMVASLNWIETPDYANWSERWLDHYDAQTTFASYGAEFGNLEELDKSIPDEHRLFLTDLRWVVEHPEYLFVHAGLDTNAPFEMQLRILRQKDLSLAQPQWLCSKSLVQADAPPDCPLTVVSGHTKVPRVEFKSKRILVDTTGGRSGDLSCALLPEKRVLTSAGELVEAQASQSSWWKIW